MDNKMAIKTHSTIKPNSQIAQSQEPHFHLTQVRPTSSNVQVRKYPLRVVAWGLEQGESVEVRMVRVSSLGNTHWALSDDECCPCVLPPDQVANVQTMPYIKCGKPLVLTAQNPTAHIDDAGIYYFEYSGYGEVILDHYDDPVISKANWCGCE